MPLDARGKVLVKLNVSEEQFQAVLAVLPSAKSPTVSQLAGGGFAVEAVVEKRTINVLIPGLKDAGCHRHPRAADLQDRGVSPMAGGEARFGTVEEFDADRGLGEIVADGRRYPFHCAEIADGSRLIAVGARGRFVELPKLGRIEAGRIERREPDRDRARASPPRGAADARRR